MCMASSQAQCELSTGPVGLTAHVYGFALGFEIKKYRLARTIFVKLSLRSPALPQLQDSDGRCKELRRSQAQWVKLHMCMALSQAQCECSTGPVGQTEHVHGFVTGPV